MMHKIIRMSGWGCVLALIVFFQASMVRADSENLIINPAVEITSTSSATLPMGWFKGGYGDNTRLLSYPALGEDDTKGLKTEITRYTGGDAKWYFQPISVSGGDKITFSDSFKSSKASYVTVQYQLQNGVFKYVDIANPAAASSWNKITKTFTVPKNYASPVKNLTVFHLIKSTGWIITDNYSIQKNEVVDTIPPLVSINPVVGQPVSGTITLSATSSDNILVAGVRFNVDGTDVGSESMTSPYNISFDTTTVSDGLHTVLARARDASGNTATSSSIQVDVLNHPTQNTGILIVRKHVINDNNGIATSSQFNLRVTNGTSTEEVLGSPFLGSEAGKELILQPGIYTVKEGLFDGYSRTGFSGDCDNQGVVTVLVGTTTTCTITNDDIPPILPAQGTITVHVVVINDNDGTKQAGDFALAVDAQSIVTGATTTFPVGAHVVSQAPDSNYTTVISGDCDLNGNINLADGDYKVCTITNDDIPSVPPIPEKGTITVNMVVVNNDGGIKTPQDFAPVVDAQGIVIGAETSFLVGTHTVSVLSDPDYITTISGDCDELGNVVLALGDHKVCTITNDDIPPVPPTQGTITVYVVVINDNDGTKQPEDFAPAVDTQGVIIGAPATFPVGSHVVSETTDPNYTTTISGDCDELGNVVLDNGDHKVCTITNDDIPPVPPVPSNFIINPSVEVSSTSPSSVPLAWYKGGYGANSRTLTHGNDAQEGVRGLETEITSYTSGDSKWYFQPVPVFTGQLFTYSEYYKSNVPSEIDIQYQLQDGTFKYVVLSHLPATSTWDQVSFIFTIPTYSSPVVKMTVFHVIESVGWLRTDNYSLSTYTPPPIDPNNAILNPSVETPSGTISSFPAFWSRSSSAGSVSQFMYPVTGYNSSRAMQVTITDYSGGAGAKWYFQSVPVNPGDDYSFSDYFKSTAQSYLSVQFQMDDGTYKYLDLTPLASSATWKQAKGTFTIPPNAVSLTVLHVLKGVGTLATDNYVLKKLSSGAFSEGMVSFNFDDGLESVYQNAIPILNAAGIKSTQYVITEALNMSGYWTTEQLGEIADAGHEIGVHTRTHPYLTQLDSAELLSEIDGSKADLVRFGYNPTTFSYPYGDFNNMIVEEVENAGFKGARSVHSGFNNKNTDPFSLNDQHVEAHTSIEQIKSWIDQAILTKSWLILELHDIDHSGVLYSTTPEILQQIVDYVRQKNILVISNAEGVTKILE
ncbi:MAG: polysaccharide deacetylase family protein [Candidatus Paceibacterota bacterium]|jgi:peptidoglycan/xylan/chitin deacetylase (PgdA/CDA1 family)